jgi:SAM-dependent methyltransferase
VAVVSFLEEIGALANKATIADIGAGTGISTDLFAADASRVYAVEPNAPMRQALSQQFGDKPVVQVVEGSAEATTLPDASVDLITAAQAFHWFNRDAARVEFRRILRKEGWVALFWNTRLKAASPFAKGYEALIREYAIDHDAVRHDAIPAADIEAFLKPGITYRAEFFNTQWLTIDEAIARVRSASYMPAPEHPRYAAMIESVHYVFNRCQRRGKVDLHYKTEVFAARWP